MEILLIIVIVFMLIMFDLLYDLKIDIDENLEDIEVNRKMIEQNEENIKSLMKELESANN